MRHAPLFEAEPLEGVTGTSSAELWPAIVRYVFKFQETALEFLQQVNFGYVLHHSSRLSRRRGLGAKFGRTSANSREINICISGKGPRIGPGG